MSFDPLEYERTGGMYGIGEDSETSIPSLEVWKTDIDPTSAFARDLVNLVVTTEKLNEDEKSNLLKELPENYTFATNVTLDALDWAFILKKTEQAAGYHVAFVGPEGDKGQHIKKPDQMGVYQLEGENRGQSSVHFLYNIPEFALVTSLTDASRYPCAELLVNTDHYKSLYANDKLDTFHDTGLLERGFMFASLGAARTYLMQQLIKPEMVSDDDYFDRVIKKNVPKVLDMYETLAADDVQPLGLEELHGLMATAMHAMLEEHPELRPLPEPLA